MTQACPRSHSAQWRQSERRTCISSLYPANSRRSLASFNAASVTFLHVFTDVRPIIDCRSSLNARVCASSRFAPIPRLFNRAISPPGRNRREMAAFLCVSNGTFGTNAVEFRRNFKELYPRWSRAGARWRQPFARECTHRNRANRPSVCVSDTQGNSRNSSIHRVHFIAGG